MQEDLSEQASETLTGRIAIVEIGTLKVNEIIQRPLPDFYQTYINHDIRRLFPKLDSIRYRRFISTLASLSGTIINKVELGRSIDVSEVTIRDYLEIADKTHVWRTIPSYGYSKSKSALKMPKGILRNSGFTHYLAAIDSREALLRSP